MDWYRSRNREDVPRLIEELFRQRLVVEVQAEGGGKAAISFVYDYHVDSILSAIRAKKRCSNYQSKLII